MNMTEELTPQELIAMHRIERNGKQPTGEVADSLLKKGLAHPASRADGTLQLTATGRLALRSALSES